MEASHGWVPVDTLSTPVPSSEGRLWVAQTTDTSRAPNVKSPAWWRSHRFTEAALIAQLLRDNLTIWTLVRKIARADEPATTEAASAPEPAAESPFETAEDEITDKAEELNIEVIMAKEPAALDPTKRRLELWKQSTSRKLMIQVLPNRVCSIAAERADHRVRERSFKSDSGVVSRSRRNLQCPGIQHHRRRAAAVPSSRAEKL